MVEFRIRLKLSCESHEGTYKVTYNGKRLTLPNSLFVFNAKSFDEGMESISMTEVKEITVTEDKRR